MKGKCGFPYMFLLILHLSVRPIDGIRIYECTQILYAESFWFLSSDKAPGSGYAKFCVGTSMALNRWLQVRIHLICRHWQVVLFRSATPS